MCNTVEVSNTSSNTCVNDLIDGPLKPLIELNLGLAVAYISTATLLTVCGVVGNITVIYLIYKEKSLSEHAKYFILNNAVADMCVAGIANPTCIAGAFLGMQHFSAYSVYCSFIASLCLTACVCVFLNFTNLTINRWFFICNNKHYHTVYNKLTIAIICILCWGLGFVAELPNFFGWGGHYFDQKAHQCLWDRTASRSYTLFVAIGLLTTPLILNGFCNIAIFRKLVKVKRAIGVFQITERNNLVQSMRSAKTLICIHVTYLVCWTPYIIMLICDHGDTFSTETHLFVTLLAHAHSSTAFFIYLAFNRRFKEQFTRLLCARNRNRVAPSVDVLYTVPSPLNKTSSTDKKLTAPAKSRGAFSDPATPEVSKEFQKSIDGQREAKFVQTSAGSNATARTNRSVILHVVSKQSVEIS